MEWQVGNPRRVYHRDRQGYQRIVAYAVLNKGAGWFGQLKLAEAVLDRDLKANYRAAKEFVVGIQEGFACSRRKSRVVGDQPEQGVRIEQDPQRK